MQEQETPTVRVGKREKLLPEAERAWVRLRGEMSAALAAAGRNDYTDCWRLGREEQDVEGSLGGAELEMENLNIVGEEEKEEGGVLVGEDEGDEEDDVEEGGNGIRLAHEEYYEV